MADAKQEQDAAARAKAEQDARARAEADARAKAAAPAAPAKPEETTATLAEAVKNLERRTRLPGPAAPTAELDRTVPGGKYLVKGKLVNAHGREVDEQGRLLHPEQQQVDAHGRLV